MNLIRILAIVLIIWVIFRLVRLALDRKKQIEPGETLRLVRCTYCGTQFPENMAIHDSDNLFCCEDHRQLHKEPR